MCCTVQILGVYEDSQGAQLHLEAHWSVVFGQDRDRRRIT